MTVKIKPDPFLENNLMAFGWECDKGWYRLIVELIYKLNKIEDVEIEVLQVKEKYGELCFYVSGGTDKVFDTIDKYVLYSLHICEHCGEFYTTKMREKNSWYKTLCDACAKELGYT